MTLIYLKENERVLLLKRDGNKDMVPNKWLGLGGKVEPGEDIVSSAKREFYEETGLSIRNPTLRGTFSWISDEEYAGTLYIFVATEYGGDLSTVCDEGKLQWHNINSIDNLVSLADHQKFFLKRILTDDMYFYTGIAFYKEKDLVGYVDNTQYFEERKQKRSS